MSAWEKPGQSDEWHTPAYIFDAMGTTFDLDVATCWPGPTHVPAHHKFYRDGLRESWFGFCWMNAPFGGRNGLKQWLDKFFEHGDGVALVPDRTSAPWFQEAAKKADAVLFISPKIKFLRPDGTAGRSPSTGTALMAAGERGVQALHSARGLGWLCRGV